MGVMQAAGVLLACTDKAACTAAATAMATSLPASCSHCLHHFLPQRPDAKQTSEVAGLVQGALAAQLQQCSHAVVIVDRIDAVPTAVLPVLIHALSERGALMQNGQAVDTTKALFVATILVPHATVQQVWDFNTLLQTMHRLWTPVRS